MIREGKEFNKSDIKYTTRMNVFTGRTDHAPESKLAPTFAKGGGRKEREEKGVGLGEGGGRGEEEGERARLLGFI